MNFFVTARWQKGGKGHKSQNVTERGRERGRGSGRGRGRNIIYNVSFKA